MRSVWLAGCLLAVGCRESRESIDRSQPPVVRSIDASSSEATATADGGADDRAAVNSIAHDREGGVGESHELASKIAPRSEAEPVSARLSVPKRAVVAGETFDVAVELHIGASHEIQSLQARPPNVATRIELALPSGWRAVGEWHEPTPGRSVQPDGHPTHVGKPTFTCAVRVADDAEPGPHELACTVHFQACNERRCLRPSECKLCSEVVVER